MPLILHHLALVVLHFYQIQYTKSQITTIEAQDSDDDFNINFGDYFELESDKNEEPQVPLILQLIL
ncbi:hypothetical protein ACT4UT_08275, partial [Bacillus sp. B-TM1]